MNLSGRRTIARKIARGALALGLLIGCAHAVDAPPATVQGDPFVKKDVPPPTPPGPPSNLIFTIETYDVDPGDAAKLLQESDANGARFKHVLDLQKMGKARLAMVLCGVTISGEQCSVEQGMQMPFASDFDPKSPAVKATNYQKENLGYRFVYKGQTVPDGKSYDGVLFYPRLRFAGFHDQQMANGTIAQARFASASLQLRLLLPFGQMQLLGTPRFESLGTPSFDPKVPGSDFHTTLAFGKIDRVPVESSQQVTNRYAALTNEFIAYSMEPEKAAQVLNENQTPDSAYQAVQALVKSGEAKVEQLSVVTTSPGVKSGNDEGADVIYPDMPGSPSFITTGIGFRLELTAQYLGDNTSVLLLKNVFTTWDRFLGTLHGQAIKPGKGDLPVIGNTNITTTIHAALGEHELLGTFTPSFDSGLDEPKSEHRIWLKFVRVTLVNP